MSATIREGREVTAKTRKRCPHCRKMIEVGARAFLTDDRYQSARIQDFGRSYPRGAWHLWHVECAAVSAACGAEVDDAERAQ